jgi:hypothetical protein
MRRCFHNDISILNDVLPYYITLRLGFRTRMNGRRFGLSRCVRLALSLPVRVPLRMAFRSAAALLFPPLLAAALVSPGLVCPAAAQTREAPAKMLSVPTQSEVQRLQRLLKLLAKRDPQLYASVDPGRVDGVYGAETMAAIINFQRITGAPVEPAVNATLWSQVLAALASLPASDLADPSPGSAGNGREPEIFVQVASFKDANFVRKAWKRVRKTYPTLLADKAAVVERAVVDDRGTFFRLLFGPLAGQRTAKDLCLNLRNRNQSCLIVRREAGEMEIAARMAGEARPIAKNADAAPPAAPPAPPSAPPADTQKKAPVGAVAVEGLLQPSAKPEPKPAVSADLGTAAAARAETAVPAAAPPAGESQTSVAPPDKEYPAVTTVPQRDVAVTTEKLGTLPTMELPWTGGEESRSAIGDAIARFEAATGRFAGPALSAFLGALIGLIIVLRRQRRRKKVVMEAVQSEAPQVEAPQAETRRAETSQVEVPHIETPSIDPEKGPIHQNLKEDQDQERDAGSEVLAELDRQFESPQLQSSRRIRDEFLREIVGSFDADAAGSDTHESAMLINRRLKNLLLSNPGQYKTIFLNWIFLNQVGTAIEQRELAADQLDRRIGREFDLLRSYFRIHILELDARHQICGRLPGLFSNLQH